MKKMLSLLLLACLLPWSALADMPTLLQEIPVQFANVPERIADYLLLPGDVLLVNDHIRLGNDCQELVEAIAPDGAVLWSVPLYTYEPDHYPKERVLSLEKDAVLCLLYDQIRDGETCQRVTCRISLTGEVVTPCLEDSIAPAEVAQVSIQGNFRAERYFDDYEELMVPTVLTYLPTGSTRALELPGQGNFHTFGDRLLYVASDPDGAARLWVFDESLTSLQENVTVDFGCAYPVAAYSAQDEKYLYLFVWTNRPGTEGREYAVYPFDKDMNRQEALCSFNLGVIESEDFLTDYALSLSAAVTCGDGFLLLAHHPWQWGQEMQHDLYYLSRTDGITLLDTFAQDDMPILLSGGRLLMRTEAGYVLRTWGMPD